MQEAHYMLRQLRNARGISQHKLSEISGVHRVTIAKIQAGTQLPSTSTLIALCKALNASIDDMITFDETESEPSMDIQSAIGILERLSPQGMSAALTMLRGLMANPSFVKDGGQSSSTTTA